MKIHYDDTSDLYSLVHDVWIFLRTYNFYISFALFFLNITCLHFFFLSTFIDLF